MITAENQNEDAAHHVLFHTRSAIGRALDLADAGGTWTSRVYSCRTNGVSLIAVSDIAQLP